MSEDVQKELYELGTMAQELAALKAANDKAQKPKYVVKNRADKRLEKRKLRKN